VKPPHSLRVVSNQNVATYIKELVLEPIGDRPLPAYQPGQYMQLDIPAYPEIRFSQFEVAEPFATSWKAHHVTDFKAHNPLDVRRNYSIATHPGSAENQLRFQHSHRHPAPWPRLQRRRRIILHVSS
jgi:Na+-transporting NADH:ubiquinone oxidoreductase subunit F